MDAHPAGGIVDVRRNLTSANPEHSISYPPTCPAQEPDCANRMLEMDKTTDTSRLCVGIPFPA